MRLLIVPRWAGTPDSDFYPWLADLAAAGNVAGVGSVERLSMPDPETPRIESWVSHITARLAIARDPTILLAHSVGCQAALRALSRPACAAVHATVLVAPWRTVDKPWPTLRPWIDEPFDVQGSRPRAGRVRALVSDNDPFTSDWAETGHWLESELVAEVAVCQGARHFNGTEERAVLRAIEELTG